MNSAIFTLLASAMLMLPAGVADRAGHGAAESSALGPDADSANAPLLAGAGDDGLTSLAPQVSEAPMQQVRIQQRVIVRIAPRPPEQRRNVVDDLPKGELFAQYQERKTADCIPIASISGVQPGPENRLLLFTKDRKVLSARLDRSCRARDFYSGFYVENSKDGKLCVSRDMLQSRAGASCAVSDLKQLVLVRK